MIQVCAASQIADLPARELLPGDVVQLHVGDRVPADMRLVRLKTATLRCEQASLTGEAVAVQKATEPIADVEIEIQVQTPSSVVHPTGEVALEGRLSAGRALLLERDGCL